MGAKKSKPANDREAVLLQALVGGEKYGLELQGAYGKATGKRMPSGSLYVTLARMEEVGFVKSREGEATHERGGNKRRYFKLTGTGATALDEFRMRLRANGLLFRVAGAVLLFGGGHV